VCIAGVNVYLHALSLALSRSLSLSLSLSPSELHTQLLLSGSTTTSDYYRLVVMSPSHIDEPIYDVFIFIFFIFIK
jgi:hypothetical protein